MTDHTLYFIHWLSQQHIQVNFLLYCFLFRSLTSESNMAHSLSLFFCLNTPTSLVISMFEMVTLNAIYIMKILKFIYLWHVPTPDLYI